MRPPTRVCAIAAIAIVAGMVTPTIATADAVTPAPTPATDGKAWEVNDFPSQSGGLSAVATEGDATVAVGFGITDTSRFTPLAAMWDGDSWQRQPVRISRAGMNVQLADVDLINSTSGWAVGDIYDGVGTSGIAAKWNGTSWRGVPTDGLVGDIGFLGVTALGPRNVWAVGQIQVGDRVRPYIAHYLRGTWERAKLPSLTRIPSGAGLTSITQGSGHDLWATGLGGLALRYHNSTWKQVDVPRLGGTWVNISKIRNFGDAGLWAVGLTSKDGRHPVALRWTGSAWDFVSTPLDDIAQLNDIARTASGLVAVGYTSDGPNHFYGLQLDPNGPAKPLALPPGDSVLFGLATNEAGTELWTVGSGPRAGGGIQPYAAVRS